MLASKFYSGQGDDRSKVKKLIQPYILAGRTLKEAAADLGMGYSTLKHMMHKQGLKYPSSDVLRNNFCQSTFGLDFEAYIKKCKLEKMSNNEIARTLNIQKCTLYILADKYKLDIKDKPYTLSNESKKNIGNASKARAIMADNALLFQYEGSVDTLNGWANEMGINVSTLRRRLVDLKWPTAVALSKEPYSHRRPKPRKQVQAVIAKIPSRKLTAKDEAAERFANIYSRYQKDIASVPGKWYMLRVLSGNQAKGRLYVSANGAIGDVLSAGIVDHSSLAQAFINCIEFRQFKVSKKLRNANVVIEQFFAPLGLVDSLDSTALWRDKLLELANVFKKCPEWTAGSHYQATCEAVIKLKDGK